MARKTFTGADTTAAPMMTFAAAFDELGGPATVLIRRTAQTTAAKWRESRPRRIAT